MWRLVMAAVAVLALASCGAPSTPTNVSLKMTVFPRPAGLTCERFENNSSQPIALSFAGQGAQKYAAVTIPAHGSTEVCVQF